LPCTVAEAGNTPAGKVLVPVMLAAVKLVKAAPSPEAIVPNAGVIKVGEFPKLVKEEAVTPLASVVPVNVPAAAATAGKLVISEPSSAGYLPAAVVCTNCVFPLNVLPAIVTAVGKTPAGSVFVPVIFAAVIFVNDPPFKAGKMPVKLPAFKLVRLDPLIAGSDVIVKTPVLFNVALPVSVTGACGVRELPVR
jgi:hypothetical protein